ncbi:hypothetical protein Acsp03_09280 [Actinomadura sp. NBRC 104412]|nr:hypothetical protein Acsp03_09280 [Actinomadura sp. NBRC 104412]
MISPQTTPPTANAAIQDPCHSVSMRSAWSLIGSGMPRRAASLSLLHAVAVSASRPSAPAPVSARVDARRPRTGVRRSLERVGLTECLPHG